MKNDVYERAKEVFGNILEVRADRIRKCQEGIQKAEEDIEKVSAKKRAAIISGDEAAFKTAHDEYEKLKCRKEFFEEGLKEYSDSSPASPDVIRQISDDIDAEIIKLNEKADNELVPMYKAFTDKLIEYRVMIQMLAYAKEKIYKATGTGTTGHRHPYEACSKAIHIYVSSMTDDSRRESSNAIDAAIKEWE